MELRQLRYFVTVVEEGTISAAAKKLFMTQPPLSAQLHLLEKELGCQLLERGQRQVKMTPAGRLLYEKATALLEESRITGEEVRALSASAGGVLHAGVVSSVSSTLAAAWFADYLNDQTGVTLDLHEANTYQLLEQLKTGALHFAILRTPYPQEGLTQLLLKKEQLVALVPENFLAPGQTSILLDELSRLPLILYRRWERIVLDTAREQGILLRSRCLCDDARTAVALVESGAGVSLVPESARGLLQSENIGVLPLDDMKITTQIMLVYNASAYLPPCAKAFIEQMKKKGAL